MKNGRINHIVIQLETLYTSLLPNMRGYIMCTLHVMCDQLRVVLVKVSQLQSEWHLWVMLKTDWKSGYTYTPVLNFGGFMALYVGLHKKHRQPKHTVIT